MRAGTLEETQAEMARLQELAAALVAGDVAAAAAQPVAEDDGGRLLGLVLRWREMRQQAIQREISMLKQRQQQLEAGQLPTVVEAFAAWLSENGAQVTGECLLLGGCATAHTC